MVVNWANDGKEIKGLLTTRGISITKRVVGEKHYFKEGISWALRTTFFQPHIIPKGYIFTSGRSLTVFDNSDEILSTCSLWNSKYYDYCVKLNMEKDLQPKFINGIINNLPYPNFPVKRKSSKK